MQQYSRFYIDGQWQNPNSDQTIEVINPANDELCATVPAANNADIDSAISAARKGFDSWSQTTSEFRSQIIHAIADEMESRKDDFAAAISMTMGCPLHIAEDIQVAGAIEAFRNFANLTTYVAQTETHKTFIQTREAIGVTVLINPWNYPLSQLVGKLGPALATGCTVIAKPAEQTPLQDIIMAEIMEKVGLPNGVFNLITGYGADIGEYLCSHADVDMVSFTGSTQAGIKVAQAASTTVKRVCQELGGKSPYIITEDADLEAAVRYGIEDVMLNSGQTCSSLTRMLVPASKYSNAVELAKKVAEENSVGNPQDGANSMGPVSSRLQQNRVFDYINKGVSEGAQLITGGTALPAELQQGAYVLPTIFAKVTNQMTIAREEIFGPVVSIIKYQDIEEAIQIANDTIYGLSSSVYAKDEIAALKIAKRLKAGQCYIQGSYFNSDAPFGGFKQSGNGREWGEEGLKEFIETKSIITA